MTNSTPLYTLADVKRYYIQPTETVKAIDGIDLIIHMGEFLVIIGPSGSGKTTLLNVLAGLDSHTGGSIHFNGQDLSDLTDSQLCDLRRHNIGIMFQFYNMHPSFTAQENIEYPMLIAGVPRVQRAQRALDLLEQMNLLEKKDNYPIELSGGEKQRVGIARALANNPDVIIADEPTGDLDSENAEAVINLLLKINKQQKTIIMVTHDDSLLTDEMHIIQLVDGQITSYL